MPLDVFEEDPTGSDFPDDPGDMRPEVPRVIGSFTLAGSAEGLAGISGSDAIHLAAPRAAVEGFKIVPYRRRIQCLVFHPRHESGRGMCFALDESHSPISGFSEQKAEIKASISGAKRDPGAWSGAKYSFGM